MNVPRSGDMSKIYQIIGMAVLGLAAGGGGSLALDALNPPRPDPFTGTMGREMRAEMTRSLEVHDARIRALEQVTSGCAEAIRHLSDTLKELRLELREARNTHQP